MQSFFIQIKKTLIRLHMLEGTFSLDVSHLHVVDEAILMNIGPDVVIQLWVKLLRQISYGSKRII